MDLKSFAALLAQRQGGVSLKPGHSWAYAGELLTITIDYLSDNEAIVLIRRNL